MMIGLILKKVSFFETKLNLYKIVLSSMFKVQILKFQRILT